MGLLGSGGGRRSVFHRRLTRAKTTVTQVGVPRLRFVGVPRLRRYSVVFRAEAYFIIWMSRRWGSFSDL